jgi:hypothetical protein
MTKGLNLANLARAGTDNDDSAKRSVLGNSTAQHPIAAGNGDGNLVDVP